MMKSLVGIMWIVLVLISGTCHRSESRSRRHNRRDKTKTLFRSRVSLSRRSILCSNLPLEIRKSVEPSSSAGRIIVTLARGRNALEGRVLVRRALVSDIARFSALQRAPACSSVLVLRFVRDPSYERRFRAAVRSTFHLEIANFE
jgi:hypothetical protein